MAELSPRVLLFAGCLAALLTLPPALGRQGDVSPSQESGPSAPPSSLLDVPTLLEKYEADAFKDMGEAAFRQLLPRLDPLTMLEATNLFLKARPEYTCTLVKYERLSGKWSEDPDVMAIRYRKAPLAIYMKYVKGPHTGRQVLYNHAVRPGELTVKEAGLLGFTSFQFALDHPAVKKASNHSLLELGLDFPLTIMMKDLKTLRSRGGSVDLGKGKWVEAGGERFWEMVVELPGPPSYYAHWARLRFNVRNGIIYEMEIRDAMGLPLERFIYKDARFGKLPAGTFDESNPEYDF